MLHHVASGLCHTFLSAPISARPSLSKLVLDTAGNTAWQCVLELDQSGTPRWSSNMSSCKQLQVLPTFSSNFDTTNLSGTWMQVCHNEYVALSLSNNLHSVVLLVDQGFCRQMIDAFLEKKLAIYIKFIHVDCVDTSMCRKSLESGQYLCHISDDRHMPKHRTLK